jgi:hypothetical protein
MHQSSSTVIDQLPFNDHLILMIDVGAIINDD